MGVNYIIFHKSHTTEQIGIGSSFLVICLDYYFTAKCLLK